MKSHFPLAFGLLECLADYSSEFLDWHVEALGLSHLKSVDLFPFELSNHLLCEIFDLRKLWHKPLALLGEPPAVFRLILELPPRHRQHWIEQSGRSFLHHRIADSAQSGLKCVLLQNDSKLESGLVSGVGSLSRVQITLSSSKRPTDIQKEPHHWIRRMRCIALRRSQCCTHLSGEQNHHLPVP